MSSGILLTALLAVHLGLPCLAVGKAMAEEPMRATMPCQAPVDDDPAHLLCAAPPLLAPAEGNPAIPPSDLAPMVHASPSIAAGGSGIPSCAAPIDAPPKRSTPAYLLHRAFLI